MEMYQINYFLNLLKYEWELAKAYPTRLIINLSWIIFGFIPQFFLWYLISTTANTLPYTTKEITLYFLFSIGLYYGVNNINSYFKKIADGTIVTSVIKPMSLTTNYFFIFLSTILMHRLPNLIIITIIGFFFTGISNSIIALILFLFGIIIGCLFFVVLFIAMFWMRNNWGIKWGVNILMMFTSGSWIPLDLLPIGLTNFFSYLPFQFMFYIPIKAFLGQMPDPKLIILYLAWIILLYLFCRILEYFALKHYEQLGG